ncbi:hypothetical protein FDECE_11181 [Fusarium decemcellulare]|nr:hypothetical protein FDECE_11181 [Fusarium decemcellulare]
MLTGAVNHCDTDAVVDANTASSTTPKQVAKIAKIIAHSIYIQNEHVQLRVQFEHFNPPVYLWLAEEVVQSMAEEKLYDYWDDKGSREVATGLASWQPFRALCCDGDPTIVSSTASDSSSITPV